MCSTLQDLVTSRFWCSYICVLQNYNDMISLAHFVSFRALKMKIIWLLFKWVFLVLIKCKPEPALVWVALSCIYRPETQKNRLIKRASPEPDKIFRYLDPEIVGPRYWINCSNNVSRNRQNMLVSVPRNLRPQKLTECKSVFEIQVKFPGRQT